MYLISILAVIVISVLMLVVSGSNALMYVDLPSIILLLLLILPILIGSDMLKDFNNAFRIAMSKGKGVKLAEMKRAAEAVALVEKTSLAGGIFISLFSIIAVLAQVDEATLIGANIAVGVLPLIYALAVVLILLPLSARLKKMVIDYLQN